MIEQEENSAAQLLDSEDDQALSSEAALNLADESDPSNIEGVQEPSSLQQEEASTLSQDPSSKAENSEDQGAKEAEESRSATNSESEPKWKKEVNRFHDDINGLLATKENYKLVAVDQKLKSSYARNWRNESNRYFQLAVQIRRRAKGSMLSGKTIV